jgi:hypothetical protein
MSNYLSYFQSPVVGLGKNLIDNGKTLVKRAIVAIEGTHTCNRGIKHEFSADRIRQLAENTNAEIANGRIVSLFLDHHKSKDAHFGDLTGFVECRPVTEEDLPFPEARGMLGKLAIFANTNIIGHIDQVKSRAIKALSPGIDTARNIIFEVSAVPIGAMPGVALFSYADIKAKRSEFQEKRTQAIECLDTFIESLRQPSEDGVINDNSQIEDWFGDFVADLRAIFDLPVSEESTPEISYSNNPYERQIVQQFAYSENPESELTEEEKEKVLTVASEVINNPPPHRSRLRARAATAIDTKLTRTQ